MFLFRFRWSYHFDTDQDTDLDISVSCYGIWTGCLGWCYWQATLSSWKKLTDEHRRQGLCTRIEGKFWLVNLSVSLGKNKFLDHKKVNIMAAKLFGLAWAWWEDVKIDFFSKKRGKLKIGKIKGRCSGFYCCITHKTFIWSVRICSKGGNCDWVYKEFHFSMLWWISWRCMEKCSPAIVMDLGVQIQIELNFPGDKTLNDGHLSALKAEEMIKTTQYWWPSSIYRKGRVNSPWWTLPVPRWCEEWVHSSNISFSLIGKTLIWGKYLKDLWEDVGICPFHAWTT